jgi:hypothetical protein
MEQLMTEISIDGKKLVQMVEDPVRDLPTAEARATASRFMVSDCIHVMTSRGVCGVCGLSPVAITPAQGGKGDVHK